MVEDLIAEHSDDAKSCQSKQEKAIFECKLLELECTNIYPNSSSQDCDSEQSCSNPLEAISVHGRYRRFALCLTP